MGMPQMAGRWTREMVLALPADGRRYELFDGGVLVTPAPSLRHQVAVAALYDVIAPWVRKHGVGRALTSPADLHLDEEELFQPDLFVLPHLPVEGSWESAPAPVLVVEILSPSSARGDRLIKRRRFQDAGIPEYWIVDLDARVVERWRPGDDRPEILDASLIWSPALTTGSLVIDLPTLFAEVGGAD
jgi:Uma2 family endonuclease